MRGYPVTVGYNWIPVTEHLLDYLVINCIWRNSHIGKFVKDTIKSVIFKSLTVFSFFSNRVKFVPIIHPPNYRERREGRHTFVIDLYVVEITVKAGVKGELYETSKHQVLLRTTKNYIWQVFHKCQDL